MTPPLSLTPQSLKRKLQEISEYNRSVTIDSQNRQSSPPLPRQMNFSFPPPAALFACHKVSSPTRSLRTASIVHSTVSQPSNSTTANMTPLQMAELHKVFSKRPAPFPTGTFWSPAASRKYFLKAAPRTIFPASTRWDPGRFRSQTASETLRPVLPAKRPFHIYLERLFRYGHPEALHLLAIVAYSERLIKSHSLFVPPAGWHRFTVAAWIVAGKALLGDQYWTNQYWARVAGITVQEILQFETVIELLQWHLQIPQMNWRPPGTSSSYKE